MLCGGRETLTLHRAAMIAVTAVTAVIAIIAIKAITSIIIIIARGDDMDIRDEDEGYQHD